ncbi:MAG TPA: DeoR/GlpR family DNA-binding transcription regulator [Microlunatus sp.]|nr:DeoR/GlpR family DNA-binding transcription regulator [Microlunatus sp.]
MTDRVGTQEDRHAVLSRLLTEQGRLDVAEAADLLGVAQETVRRDLRTLETAGVLRRVHGGAIPVEPATRVPIPTLTEPDATDAALAARVWAELPRRGTILIGSGPLALSITHAMISTPPESAGLTVVTNSLDAAVHLARVPRLAVYNIGGTVSPQTRAQEGDWALEELSRLRVDVALLCPAGVSVTHGLSESTPDAAAVAQAITEAAEERIVVCRADTLGRNAFVRFAPIDRVTHLWVAGRPTPAVLHSLEDLDLPVTIVDAPA